jgi:hypothetical protein
MVRIVAIIKIKKKKKKKKGKNGEKKGLTGHGCFESGPLPKKPLGVANHLFQLFFLILMT